MRQDEKKSYQSYLLRCWRETYASRNKGSTWRFSLEEVLGERRRHGFGNFEEVVVFLREQLLGKQGGD